MVAPKCQAASRLLKLSALATSLLVLVLATLTASAPGGQLTSSRVNQQQQQQAIVAANQQQQRVTRQASSGNKKKKPADKGQGKGKGKKELAECLAAHNKLRRQHGVPDLQWDDKIAEFAQKRSNHIAASDGAEFGHPPDLPFGENLFWHSSLATSCEHMVKGWYDEIELYDYKAPSFAPATGHFTQLIWRTTTRVGCAFATSSGKRGGIYLTCNYDPPGNFVGEFEENVPLPQVAASNNVGGRPLVTAPASAIATSTTSTTTTTSTSTTTTTSKPALETAKPKNKSKKKNKNKKNKNKNKKPGDKEKDKQKKKNKNKNKKNKNKKKATTTTTSTTTTAKPTTRR